MSNILDNLIDNKLFYAKIIAKLALYDYFSKSTIGFVDDISILQKKLRKALDVLNTNDVNYNNLAYSDLLNEMEQQDFFLKMNGLDSKETNYEKYLAIVANLSHLIFLSADISLAKNARSAGSYDIFPPPNQGLENIRLFVDSTKPSRSLYGHALASLKYETLITVGFGGLINRKTNFSYSFESTNSNSSQSPSKLDATIADFCYNAVANYNQSFGDYNSTFKDYFKNNVFNYDLAGIPTLLDGITPQIDLIEIFTNDMKAADYFKNTQGRNISKLFQELYSNDFIYELERDTGSTVFDNAPRTESERPPSSAADYLIFKRISQLQLNSQEKNYAKSIYNHSQDIFSNTCHTLGLNFDKNTGKTLVNDLRQEKNNINPLAYFNYILKSFAKGIENTFPALNTTQDNPALKIRSRDDNIVLNLFFMYELSSANPQKYETLIFNNVLIQYIKRSNLSDIDQNALIDYYEKANRKMAEKLYDDYIDKAQEKRSLDDFNFLGKDNLSIPLNKLKKDNQDVFYINGNSVNGSIITESIDPESDSNKRDVVNRISKLNFFSKDAADHSIITILFDAPFKKLADRNGLGYYNENDENAILVEKNTLFESIKINPALDATGIKRPDVVFGKYKSLFVNKQEDHLHHTFVFYQYLSSMIRQFIPIELSLSKLKGVIPERPLVTPIDAAINQFFEASGIAGVDPENRTYTIKINPVIIKLFCEALKNSDSSFEYYESIFSSQDYRAQYANNPDYTDVISYTAYENYYADFYKPVCDHINKVKKKIINRRDGILTGLKYLLNPAIKLFEFEKTFENFFGSDDQARYNRFLIDLLEKNKLLANINCISSLQKNAAFLSYIKNFAITKESFPYSMSNITKTVEQKVMFRFLTREGYGYLKDENAGSKQIIHVGLTNGMFDMMRRGDRNNLIALKIERINYLNENDITIPNYYIFDMSKYFLPFYFDENEKVKENFLFREYSDNLPFYTLPARSQFFKYKDKKIVPAGLGKEAFGTEDSEDNLDNFYKNISPEYLEQLQREVALNHLDDYFLKLYTKSTLGIDMRFDPFNILSENNFYGGTISAEDEESKTYGEVNTYINDNLFNKEEYPVEYGRSQNFLKNWTILNSAERFSDVASFKAYDRTFSLLLNSNDFLLDPINQSDASDPVSNVLNRAYNNSIYRLNGKLHNEAVIDLNIPFSPITTLEYRNRSNSNNKIFGYVVSVGMIKRW